VSKIELTSRAGLGVVRRDAHGASREIFPHPSRLLLLLLLLMLLRAAEYRQELAVADPDHRYMQSTVTAQRLTDVKRL